MAGGKRQCCGGSSSSSSNSSIPGASYSKWKGQSLKRGTRAGKKPVADQTTVKQVAFMIVIHVCRKVVLVKPELKVGVYFGALMFGSLICDFMPIPRTYMARKDNILNQYFVKLGWGWTLSFLLIFVYMTSWTYCCGNVLRVRKHLSRLLIATIAWYLCTTLFGLIETWTGFCLSDKYSTRLSCVRHGHRWIGFDISGHSFLLVYCNLVLMEEAKCIRGWERIGELIRNQEYEENSPLHKLKSEEVNILKTSYEKYTPFIKLTFIAITGLVVLWDVMLIGTILYFHTMVQKVVGGIAAVITWFVTYRVWYLAKSSPGLPGKGPFRYSDLQKGTRLPCGHFDATS